MYVLNNDYRGGYTAIYTLAVHDEDDYEVVNVRPIYSAVTNLEGLVFCPMFNEFVVLNTNTNVVRIINQLGISQGVSLPEYKVKSLVCIPDTGRALLQAEEGDSTIYVAVKPGQQARARTRVQAIIRPKAAQTSFLGAVLENDVLSIAFSSSHSTTTISSLRLDGPLVSVDPTCENRQLELTVASRDGTRKQTKRMNLFLAPQTNAVSVKAQENRKATRGFISLDSNSQIDGHVFKVSLGKGSLKGVYIPERIEKTKVY